MTDFDAKAHELLPQIITTARNKSAEAALTEFAAALKTAYNEGLEDAAWAMETEKDEPWHASFIRRKKVPV